MDIKNFIKRTQFLENMIARCILMNKKRYSGKRFYDAYKRRVDWSNPLWFDEKLIVLNVNDYHNNPKVVQCADKYRVREYVKAKGLDDILNVLYGVWDDVSQIDINKLPDNFVIKRNNDAGGVIVVPNKGEVENLEEKLVNLQKGRKKNYGVIYGEYHYRHIKPCIICEKYIGTLDGTYPIDYKFYCFDGKVRAALICVGREDEENMLRFVVNPDFELIPIMQGEKDISREEAMSYRPAIWDELVSTADKLSEDFKFVRVDLYDVDDKVLLGEMTFTPMGCKNTYFTEEGQLMLGKWLNL